MDDMNCNNVFFKEVINILFFKLDKCMLFFWNRVFCVFKILGYFMEVLYIFLIINVVRVEFILVF